ncbi:MAG: polysaccharide biosynthesis protein [Abditibacteriota bacterium]|nr:polysaccharide biosynthesis protein [Abditibacteriota bacterium]
MKNVIFTFLDRHQKKLLLIGDALAIFLAIILSFIFLKKYYQQNFVDALTSWTTYVCIIVFLVLFWIFRLYKYTWRYAGLETVTSIIAACSIGTICYAFLMKLAGWGFAKLILFIFLVFSIVFVATLRLLARYTARVRWRIYSDIPRNAVKNILLVGAHEDCGYIVKSMYESMVLSAYNIAGIVDYKKGHKGKYVANVKVVGECKDLINLVVKNNIQEVFFILNDDFDGESIRPYVIELRQKRIPVKTLNSFSDSITGNNKINLQDINVEDLLHRPSRKIDLKIYGDYIKDKVVLVTGGGGSIGSEIVRQVSALEPKQLVILGHGENSIFKIDNDIKEMFPKLNVYPVIASIADRERMFNVFEKFKPEVVFHAAAHKHVPLMELNIHEAVRNNICGTLNLVDACYEYKVNTMVQISTDKAADPSSVMGATKYVCEQIVKSTANREGNQTKFIIVRFGNVLGSRGSVIPVFLRQIQNGGPVTVTDPEMTRFFMIIPEACRLVVQAGSVGDNGKIYVLDMGQPVKIMDLAEDIISICGYTPGKDMQIKITGIRPGEKLHETLSSATENLQPTEFKGINMVDSGEVVPYDKLCEFIKNINSLEKTKDATTFIAEVNKLRN